MKKTMMYLPDDMHRFLADEARTRGLSMAEIAREAIAAYRTKAEAEKKPSASAIVAVLEDSLPDTDLAERIDEALAEHFAEGGDWERKSGLAGTD